MTIGLGLEMNGIVDLSDRVSFEDFSWEEILGSAGTANITLEFLDESVFIERLADLRIYKGDFNLFRGRCSAVELEREGIAVRAHLTVRDWNVLFPLVHVGAPDGSTFETQADGTNLGVDFGALNYPTPHHYMSDYWPLPGLPPGIDLDTFNTAPQPPALPVRTDRKTALTDLRSVMDDDAAHVSGAVRYWIDPDYAYHWQELTPSDYIVAADVGAAVDTTLGARLAQSYALMWPVPRLVSTAPYILSDHFDEAEHIIMPIRLSVKWDDDLLREAVYIRGSTVPGSGYVTSQDAGVNPNVAGGREYIDAPGSIYETDKLAIGIYNFRQNFRELLTGSASISPGYDGWRVGQTVEVSDPYFSRFVDHDLTRRILTIQRVRGQLKVRAQDSDDPAAGDIVYEIEFGDIPAGSLARQLAEFPEPEPPPVIYHFNVDWADHHLPDGGSCLVTAVLSDAGDAPVDLGGVPMEWVLLQWVDEAGTIPGTGYSLADDTGTTDASGKVFTTLSLSGGDATWFTIDAVALPKE